MSAPDFLAIEPLLIARLRDTLPAHVHVLAAESLARVTALAQPVPAVHVLYRRYAQPREDTSDRERFDLCFWTVVAVQYAAADQGAGIRTAAGPLLGSVIQTLGGWMPPDPNTYGAFALEPAPDAHYAAGFGYFPLAWRVPVKVRVASSRRSR